MPELLREVAVGLFKRVLGKEKAAEAEAPPVDDAVPEETPGRSVEDAATGSIDPSDNGQGTRGEDALAWELQAREFGDKGQAALDEGDAGEAVLQLLEALRIYEANEDEQNALVVSQHLGAALYDLGRQNEAVSVWEEIISRGCEERPVYERLIDHYEELQRGDDVARVRLLRDSIGQ